MKGLYRVDIGFIGYKEGVLRGSRDDLESLGRLGFRGLGFLSGPCAPSCCALWRHYWMIPQNSGEPNIFKMWTPCGSVVFRQVGVIALLHNFDVVWKLHSPSSTLRNDSILIYGRENYVVQGMIHVMGKNLLQHLVLNGV